MTFVAALRIPHRVVADGDARILSPHGRFDLRTFIHHLLRYRRAYRIGSNHTGIGAVVHLLEQLQQDDCTLAESGKDERSALIQVCHIVFEGATNIIQRYRHPGFGGAVAGEGLKRALPVIRRVEIESTAEEGVHSQHLAVERLSHTVVVSMGVMIILSVKGIVACLRRYDVEHVGFAATVGDIPLCRITVIRGWWQHILRQPILVLHPALCK